MNLSSSLNNGPWPPTIEDDCLLKTFTVFAGLMSLEMYFDFSYYFDLSVIVFESKSLDIFGFDALGGRLTLSPIFLLLINYFSYL